MMRCVNQCFSLHESAGCSFKLWKLSKQTQNAEGLTLWWVNKRAKSNVLLNPEDDGARKAAVGHIQVPFRLCWPAEPAPPRLGPPPPAPEGAPDSVGGSSPARRSPAGRARSGTAGASWSRAPCRCPCCWCTRCTDASSRRTGAASHALSAAAAGRTPLDRRGRGTPPPPPLQTPVPAVHQRGSPWAPPGAFLPRPWLPDGPPDWVLLCLVCLLKAIAPWWPGWGRGPDLALLRAACNERVMTQCRWRLCCRSDRHASPLSHACGCPGFARSGGVSLCCASLFCARTVWRCSWRPCHKNDSSEAYFWVSAGIL